MVDMIPEPIEHMVDGFPRKEAFEFKTFLGSLVHPKICLPILTRASQAHGLCLVRYIYPAVTTKMMPFRNVMCRHMCEVRTSIRH
jgi:hypothetical protein